MNEDLRAARLAELKVVAASLRAELHRYASRLVGSRFDGEDVVQDVMERALLAVGDLAPDVPLRPWLFRITHNRAIDLLRMRNTQTAFEDREATLASDAAEDPHEQLARQETALAAIARFGELSVVQRSVVVLKDVLGHSLAEITQTLGLSLLAVKGHLHRGRRALEESHELPVSPAPEPAPDTRRYADLFNRHDWEGLRAQLADDVRLVQHDKAVLVGREKVGTTFFGIYGRMTDWAFLAPAIADGIEVLAVFERSDDAQPAYIMRVEWENGRVTSIHDYRYTRYVMREMQVEIPAGS